MTMRRRALLTAGAALATTGLVGCASHPGVARAGAPARPHVLVIGGGYGGATAAKYLRLWSGGRIDVTLIEPDAAFMSCPMSNLVLAGARSLTELTTTYDALTRRHGVTLRRDRVARLDPQQRVAVLDSGARLSYDKAVLAPGIEMIWDSVEGAQQAHADGRVLQAWKAGPETQALRRQLEAMPDGGVFAITIPEAPYRCPPGPYERACLVAAYFKAFKPRSKVLVLDANQDVTSKPALFKRAWAEQYPGMVEYRSQHRATGVDAATGVIRFEIQDDVRADVLNVLPSMRAGAIAVQSGLATANARWCGVNYLNFESSLAPHLHIIGDAIQVAPAMPKSAHMANGHAKVVAAAIVAELNGWEIDPTPMLTNTCYSFIDPQHVVHVASVHAYVAAERTYRTVTGSGGLSPAPNEAEATLAWQWARSIWADSLG